MSFTMTPSLFNAYLYGVCVGAIITLLLMALITVLVKVAHRRWKQRQKRERWFREAPIRGSGSIRMYP